MGVVSPVTAVIAAVTPVCIGIARGEHLGLGQTVGVGLAIVAIALISFSLEENGVREFSTRGLREAVLSGVLIGV